MIKIITSISEKGHALVVVNTEEKQNASANEEQTAGELKFIISKAVGLFLEIMNARQQHEGGPAMTNVIQPGRIVLQGETFIVTEESKTGRTILCLKCGRKSHSAQDVENKYCGHCHTYHEATAQ